MYSVVNNRRQPWYLNNLFVYKVLEYCKPCYEVSLSEMDSKIIEDMDDIEDLEVS